jgi:hypothetical protein
MDHSFIEESEHDEQTDSGTKVCSNTYLPSAVGPTAVAASKTTSSESSRQSQHFYDARKYGTDDYKNYRLLIEKALQKLQRSLQSRKYNGRLRE